VGRIGASVFARIARTSVRDVLQSNKREPVCTENVIRIDLVKESLNFDHDGRAAFLLSDVAGVAVRVEEPT
jgi:hypothetical protein